MSEYIERDAFLADKKWLYCTDCEKRKGKKRGKMVTLYEIGEAPCKSCGIHDMLEEVEAYPAADVRPVVKAKWEDVHIDRPEIADLEVASMFCPNCNRWYNKVYHYGNPIEFVNFCSFCGADMMEGET